MSVCSVSDVSLSRVRCVSDDVSVSVTCHGVSDVSWCQ